MSGTQGGNVVTTAEFVRSGGSEYGHGKLFGYEAAKCGRPRRCPYLPEFGEAIRGWLEGWDDWWNMQPEWKQKERPQ